MSPQTKEKEEFMSWVPYSNALKGLMYVIICTTPNITLLMSVVSCYMTYLENTASCEDT